MWLVVAAVLATLALRGSRAAYVAFVLFALLLIPARAGFEVQPLLCEFPVSVASGLYSLRNWQHIVLGALVSAMTMAQFREHGRGAVATAIVVTTTLGLVAELHQGVFRSGNCRMRDLVPDMAGALLGVGLAWAWRRRGRARG